MARPLACAPGEVGLGLLRNPSAFRNLWGLMQCEPAARAGSSVANEQPRHREGDRGFLGSSVCEPLDLANSLAGGGGALNWLDLYNGGRALGRRQLLIVGHGRRGSDDADRKSNCCKYA